jgi:hypothetical protein
MLYSNSQVHIRHIKHTLTILCCILGRVSCKLETCFALGRYTITVEYYMSSRNLFPTQVYRQHCPRKIRTTTIYKPQVTLGQARQTRVTTMSRVVDLNGIGYARLHVQNTHIWQNSTRVSRDRCHGHRFQCTRWARDAENCGVLQFRTLI